MEKDYILTQEGKAKLEEELHYLETEKRAEIGERIRVAREFGDISENSEYDDAKNEQAMMEGRIAEITRILGEATVVDAPTKSSRCTSAARSRSTWAATSVSLPSLARQRAILLLARSPTSLPLVQRSSVPRRATRSTCKALPVVISISRS